ncbi:MAG TPA: hypothetical protein VGK73_20050 [Polyangiaceae bacterium]
MLAKTWRYLLLGGISLGLASVTACSSEEDPGDDDGGSSGTGTSGAGSSGAGSAGKGAGGSTGGAGTGSGGSAGSTGGAGTSGTAGTAAGTAGAGGTSAGASGAGAGGTAGTSPDGGTTAVGGSAGDNVGGGGATAGTGGGGMAATLVEPIDRGNGDYVLEFSDGLFFKVNSAGARVVDVHLGAGMNLLTSSSVDDINYGSTFWPSPQTWTWPPTENLPEINNGPYTGTVASPSVTLVGAANAGLGLKVTKKFTADLAKGAIVVDYTMIATAAGKSFAPWEITRFFKRGLTFYPTGSTPTAQQNRAGFPIVPTSDAAGCTWHDAAADTTAEGKMIADGQEGWLAHVDGTVVVVKKFQNIAMSMAAPDENEIELYVNGTKGYIEVEQQGAYGAVSQDTGVTWTVTWYVRQLPSTITPSVGNQMLVDYVKSLVQ